jgi:hypothetical protein
MHERVPVLTLTGRRGHFSIRDSADEQTLNGTPARDATAEQPGRENAGVVHHQYIALSQEAGQVFDCRMHDRARPAIEVQHPRRSSVRGRFLGDELWRESEVEVADVHPRVMLLRARNAGD